MSAPLSLSDIISISVSAASVPIGAQTFNQGLIVGPSAVIPSYGSNPRIRQYSSLAGMIADGFTNVEPEYLAASIYFDQQSGPQYVWIGRQDLTAIKTVIPHSGDAGTGYAVGDLVYPSSGGTNAILTVLTIGGGGTVASLGTTIGNQGTGFTVESALATTTSGAGTGLEIDVTAVGESYLQAVEACSLASNNNAPQNWYGFMCCGAVDADHLALAAWSTANWTIALYFGSTTETAVSAGTAANIALQLQALKYRSFLIFSTTQSGLYPNNIYAAAGPLGEYCGLNTGLAGSYFTLNLKEMTGVGPEPLTQAQYLAITQANCNVSASFAQYEGYLVPGILGSGEYFDQILFRAMLVNQIQINLMNLLVSTPAVPMTNAGEHQLIAQVDDACANLASIGYIAPGVWDGNPVLNLQPGTALPSGYLDQAQSYQFQSSEARAARQAMPIYCAIIEADAVQSVQVTISVQL